MAESPLENIGPNGRLLRLYLGGLLLAFSLGLLGLLIGLQARPGWRLFLLLPLWGGALGLLQARARTCIFLAARGMREDERGIEPVADPEVAGQLRRRAFRVQLQALAAAGAGTLLAVLLPL